MEGEININKIETEYQIIKITIKKLGLGESQSIVFVTGNPWVISGPSVPIPALVGMGTAAANTKEEDNDS